MANNHVMFDLETLGTKPGAVVVSIGAVKFDPWGEDDLSKILSSKSRLFYRVLNRQEQVNTGQVVDAATVDWWFGQNVEARKVFDEPGDSVEQCLRDFLTFCRGCKGLWANGPSFDHVILRDTCSVFGSPFPVNYWQDRCVRTVHMLAGSPKCQIAGLTAHDALQDAIKQVLKVQYCMGKISEAQ